MARVGFVYGTNSGFLRRTITGTENFAPHVGPGESIVIADADLGTDEARGRDLIAIATGKPSLKGRCVAVDQANDVTAVLMADPEIDVLPGKTLHLHDRAGPGWRYDPARKEFFDNRPAQPQPTEADKAASLARHNAQDLAVKA